MCLNVAFGNVAAVYDMLANPGRSDELLQDMEPIYEIGKGI